MRVRKVFLCYRREGGADAARVVRDALALRHFRVFMDVEDLRSGHFEKAILTNIEQCSDFVVVLTPGCLDRCQEEGDWFRWEIAQAIALGKNIVPVLTEGFESWPALPPDLSVLRSYQTLVYSRYLHDASIDKLASWLRPPLLQRLPRVRWMALTLFLVLMVWELLVPPGPVARLFRRVPPPEEYFTQPFLVRFPTNAVELPANDDMLVVIQGHEGSRTSAVRENGEASIKGLSISWKKEDVKVTVNSRFWRLPEGTNTFRLSGDCITLKVERQEIVIQGRVTTAASGAALANVAVSVAGVTNMSDAQGRFSLPVPGQLAQTPVTLTAKLQGYEPFSKIITNLAESQAISLTALLPPTPFTQRFLLRGDGGTHDLLTNSGVVVLEYGGKSYREAVNDQGEAKFDDIPAAMKGKEAKVSVNAVDWRLPTGKNVVRLTGETITLTLERQDIVLQGWVTAKDSDLPLAGALVSVAGLTNTTTDKRGRFSIIVPGRLLGGPLPVAVSMQGYQPFSGNIARPREEQNVSLAPTLKPPLVAAAPTNQLGPSPPPPEQAKTPVPAGGSHGTNQPETIALRKETPPEYPHFPPLDDLLKDALLEKRNGRMRKADELSNKATSGYQRLADGDFTTFGTALAIAYLRRAELFAQDPSDRKSRESYSEAKVTSVKPGAANPSRLALATEFNNHAVFLSALGDPRQHLRVLDAFQQAITLYSNAIPSAPHEALSGLANSYQNRGLHYAKASDFANACASYGEAVRIYESLPSGQSPETIVRRVQAQRELASALDKIGKRDLAHTNYLAAIQACGVLERTNRLPHLEELARVQSDYGASLYRSSDHTRARAAYEQAIKLYRELATEKSWTNRTGFAYTLNNYGVLLAELDGKNNALEVDRVYQEALLASRDARARALELQILSNQGVLLENQGRLSEARDKFNEALKVGAGYLDQQPVEIRARLAGVRLELAKLESGHASQNQAERITRVRAADKHLDEARKLMDKLPPSPNKAELEERANELKAAVDAAPRR